MPRPVQHADRNGGGHGASVTAARGGKPERSPVLPEAEALMAETLDAHPWLERPEFRSALRRWAIAEVRCDRLQVYLDRVGMLDAHGRPRPAMAALERAEATSARARAALGFDPASFANIRAKVAEATGTRQAALDAQVVEGRRIRERRLAELEAAKPTIEELTGGDDAIEIAAEVPSDDG